jgi:predicted dehydrogenase
MKHENRRDFLKKSILATSSMLVSGAGIAMPASAQKKSPNERINVAVIGINGKGKHHYSRFCQIPNTRVTTICDVDERLFPAAVKEIEKLTGFKPKTEVDIRKVLEDKDIDAISIATPDHWHALMSVWACQAGKDVYVEKPVSFTIEEGRKMVEAARKYNRIVQAGMNMRSEASVQEAMKYLHDGKLGDIYMAKGVCFKPRDSIGFVKDSKVPQGVHWDLFLGPAPERPFNQNRFHYNWHYFWDYSTTEMGNIVHQMDLARWGMNKHEHPVKIHSAGGMFGWDSDQEVPNTQHVIFEYADGKILQYEVRGVYTNREGDVSVGNLFYGNDGWMTSAGGWKTFYGESVLSDPNYTAGFPIRKETPGPVIREMDLSGYPKTDHYENFINCIRSRRREDLYADILEGHRSATLSHLANISFRTGRKLIFNPETETFNNDVEANSYLSRQYRYPYILPKEV